MGGCCSSCFGKRRKGSDSGAEDKDEPLLHADNDATARRYNREAELSPSRSPAPREIVVSESTPVTTSIRQDGLASATARSGRSERELSSAPPASHSVEAVVSAPQPEVLRAVTRRLDAKMLQNIVERAEDDFLDVGRSVDDIEREDPSDPAAVEFVRALRNVQVRPEYLLKRNVSMRVGSMGSSDSRK